MMIGSSGASFYVRRRAAILQRIRCQTQNSTLRPPVARQNGMIICISSRWLIPGYATVQFGWGKPVESKRIRV